MKKSILSNILILVLITFTITSCGIEARLRKADKQYALGQYYTAGNLYKSVYSRIPYKQKSKRAGIAFKQGECYRKINYYRADQAYKNAIRYKFTNDTVYLRLAQVQLKNGDYKSAAENFQLFLDSVPDSQLAKDGLQSTQYALELKNDPTRYIVKKSKEFNESRYSTFSPSYAGTDADALYFTSNRKIDKKNIIRKKNSITGQLNNHIFSVKKDSKGKWEKIEPVEGTVNSEDDEGVTCFSSDGRSMYFTRSNIVEDKGTGTVILVSNRAGGTWSDPQPIELFKDSTISVGHPAISPDGETLYFVSDAPGGYGGLDIWKAIKVSGKWGAIQNLGQDINTEGDEMFPTVDSKGTLYFSSDGKPGMGGLDIFCATPIDDDHWEVKNMGVPLNSSKDDFGMAFEGKTDNGYFSSNRDETRGYDRLWSFELPELEYILSGKITDKQGETVPNAHLKIVGNNGENARIQAKGDGTYRYKMAKGTSYVLLASARGYLNEKSEINTLNVSDKKSEGFNLNFELSPISKPVQMDNIFYDFGKYTLTPASEKGLNELVKLLNDNPNITIELSAHTDYVGNNDANKKLSEQRAQSVVDYLIKAGIAKDRLTAVGYGEEKPFVVDAATAKKYPFLKLGASLTEEFIKTLTPEQQEIANQINRRTEFQVLKTTYNLY